MVVEGREAMISNDLLDGLYNLGVQDKMAGVTAKGRCFQFRLTYAFPRGLRLCAHLSLPASAVWTLGTLLD